MARSFIDPRDEAPALRRAAVLLERVRQDGGERDSDFEALHAGIGAMQRAAAAGRQIQSSAIGRMEALLARIIPPSCSRDGSLYELLRWNALVETRELLGRLARSRVRSESSASFAGQPAPRRARSTRSYGSHLLIVVMALLAFFD